MASSSASRWRIWAQGLAPWVFSVAVVWFMLTQVDLSSLRGLQANFSWGWFGLGLGCYTLTNLFRAGRNWILLERPLDDLPRLFPVSCVVSLANNSLPARMGEVAFVYFLNQVLQLGVGASTAALVAVRIFDYLMVALLFIGAWAIALPSLTAGGAQAALIAVPFLLIGVVLLALLPWLGERLLNLSLRLLHGLRWERLAQWGEQEGRAAIQRLSAFRKPSIYGRVLVLSFGVWFFTFVWFDCFLEAVGYHAALPLVIFGATFAVLTKAIPLSSVGGFGTHEAGWTLGFLLIGFDMQAAILSGFVVNILTLIVSALLGFPSLAVLYWFGRRVFPADAKLAPPVEGIDES